jgi:hypothetical protein
MRALLYALARLMGDVNAVQRGTVGKRIVRRSAWSWAAKLLGRI